MSDNTNNGPLAAAILGLAVAVDEGIANDTNTDSFNSTSSTDDDVTETNGNGNNRDNTSSDDDGNGNNRDNTSSDDDDSSIDLQVDSNIQDAFNTSSTSSDDDDNGNNRDNQANGNGNNRDNTSDDDGNGDNRDNTSSSDDDDSSIDVQVDSTIQDAFNTSSVSSDDDWITLDGVNFDVLSAVDNALNGDGNDSLLSVSQVSELIDSDCLSSPQVNSTAGFSIDPTSTGGTAKGLEGDDADLGDRATTSGQADGTTGIEAFTQNIVMGANIQYNNVDSSVVGGNSSISDGDIS